MTPGHWGVKRRATKKYRTQCAWVFAVAKPKDWEIGPVVLDVEYRCPRGSRGAVCFDGQNAMSAIKAVPDALIDVGVIETDSHANLSWGDFRLITRADEMGEKKPGVTVTVRRT